MHSSRMHTTHSLPYTGVSVQGGDLCPGRGSLFRDLCPGGLCPWGSLSGGSLSRKGVSVQEGGLCPGRGSLSRGSLSGSLCPGGSLSRGDSVQGVFVREKPPPGQRPTRRNMGPEARKEGTWDERQRPPNEHVTRQSDRK